MIKTYKVALLPNNKQNTKLFQTAGAARFAYNWVLGRQDENYRNGGKFIQDGDLRKEFTEMKKQAEYAWLNNTSNNAAKQAIKDACDAYRRFFKVQGKGAKYTEKAIARAKRQNRALTLYDLNGRPRFKSRRKSKPSFYVDTHKIEISDTHVKLEKIADSKRANRARANWIRLSEHGRIPQGKYLNPRVSFDGLHWWLTIGVETEQELSELTDEVIGIDLGIKSLAVCSNGVEYRNINKSKKVKNLKKRKRRLQRKVSRKYTNNKKGKSYKKTSNVIKVEKQLLKLNQRLTNIRQNCLHQVTSEIIARKPKAIVLEDLNVSGMMKNKHLAKAVQEQGLGEFYRQIEYKAQWSGIEFVVADRWFPSSKLCSKCGSIKSDLKLSDRVYRCECGNVIDRDLQAAQNLAKLAS